MTYNIDSEKLGIEFEYDLANMILKKGNPLLFLCLGSNKIVSDSLGALTGELLKNYYHIDATVIGDMHRPIISKNLEPTLQHIKEKYYNHTIIVIDSTIGRLDDMYRMKLNNFGLQVSCLQNQKFLGDISISSVTYVKGINGLLLLNSEEKKYIFKIANYIAHHIKNALQICRRLNQKSV